MGKAILNGNEIFGNVHLGEGGDVANPNIADVYDPTQTYNTGDRRIYNDVLYVCNDDNVTGAWDSTKWDSATIDEIISALTAADIPYSAGVSVADKIDSINTCETIYTQATYQNDIGVSRSIGNYDFRNYRVLRITLYNTAISSSTRVTVVIVNANASLGASYYPCVLNGTNGNIRFESTNTTITVLASSFGNSICIGEIKGVR